MTLGDASNLRDCLVPNPDSNKPYPLEYHDMVKHVLPDSANYIQAQTGRVLYGE